MIIQKLFVILYSQSYCSLVELTVLHTCKHLFAESCKCVWWIWWVKFLVSQNAKIRHIFRKTETFIISFLPQTIREWNKLATSICQVPSYSVFCKTLLDFIQPTVNSTFGTSDVSGLKLLTRLLVVFSHLREHKFKHNFQDTLNQLWPCSLEAGDTYNFFIWWQNFSNHRNVLFDDLSSINSDILKMSENEIAQVLLFGDKSFSEDMNFRIITSSIRFIKDSKKI